MNTDCCGRWCLRPENPSPGPPSFCGCKDSERRVPWQIENGVFRLDMAEPHPICILSYEKIVKGERHGKAKTKFSDLPWPSRILSYEKIAKGERHGKSKTKFSESKLPAGISVTVPSNSTRTPLFYESKDRKN